MHLSWLSWLLLTQNFFQVELAEELVETEEELKKELSQEFTRWEFHLFHLFHKVEQNLFWEKIFPQRFQTVQISHSLQSLENIHGGQLCIDVRFDITKRHPSLDGIVG